MQDIHSLGSSGGGGGSRQYGVDRRLRPHNILNHQQALKCPRCESLNTKFCYYNNYNLSQPRHFCKGCRRYWTKGGVLRNVPVGGGCRKNKRSSKPKQSTSSASDATAAPRKSNSHSSSENSSLTATTTTAAAAAAAEVVSGGSSSNFDHTLFNFPPESQFFISQTGNDNFNMPLIDQSPDGRLIFPETGTFTSLITSSHDPSPLGFNIAEISSYRLQNQGQLVENQSSNHQMQELANAGYLDQTGSECRISHGGLAGVDWQADGVDQDQGMFDLTGTVDQAYWSQTQWPDHNDHSLHYLP